MNDENRIGNYLVCSVAGEKYKTYVPKPLPPSPPLEMQTIYPLLDKANIAIGRLDGMSDVLSDASLFLYMYVRKEALLSSQIEGTQSSFSDLLLYENDEVPGVPIDDVEEVSNYVAAMEHGLKRIEEGFPLSLRLIKEIHQILLSGGRGSNKTPGEFRTSQNWIGGSRPGNARFVPVAPEKLMEVLDPFEKFLHEDKEKFPVLVKAALAHLQFETIHPFLDGNGRLGRLLITLILCVEGMLHQPLLYLSLYFKTNRDSYYSHLQQVRETGDWEAWIEFFLNGVIETAEQATQTAKAILWQFEEDRKLIETLGKPASSAMVVHHYLKQNPISEAPKITERASLSKPTVIKSLGHLQELGIVREITGKARHRVYAYSKYIDILNEGTEPLR